MHLRSHLSHKYANLSALYILPQQRNSQNVCQLLFLRMIKCNGVYVKHYNDVLLLFLRLHHCMLLFICFIFWMCTFQSLLEIFGRGGLRLIQAWQETGPATSGNVAIQETAGLLTTLQVQ